MITDVPALDGIAVHLLSQIDGEVERQPIVQQPALASIQAQASQVADLFAGFVRSANNTLDICIYDFRLALPAVSQMIVTAINDAASRGVAVRVAYDANEASDQEIIKQFRGAAGDPAPTGTQRFLQARLHPAVATKAIAEEPPAAPQDVAPEPIAAGSQIMHHKYMVADAASPDAAVWMGSANFTVDAWALQENNVVVISSPDLAARYTADFDDLWTRGKLSGTGRGDEGVVTINGLEVNYAFAPGEGRAIQNLIVQAISSATRRLRIASMVTSSEPILSALQHQIDSGIDFNGVYDFGETNQVRKTWEQHASDAAKLALLEAVLARMVAKRSLAFSKEHPNNAHNFMHDKIVVADDTVVTGSFNFSTNALRNAENTISFVQPQLAQAYADYIDALVTRYGADGNL
jgi:phosphatidylserine/phosphatidylglycerophosphate/cardiolipin synthase-like enzyme